MYTIARVCYDSLDKLIHNIQLYTSTQGYQYRCLSCMSSVCIICFFVCLFMCMSLRVYAFLRICPLRAHAPSCVCLLMCVFHVYVPPYVCCYVYVSSCVCPSVCMSPPCACLLYVHVPSCVCPPCEYFSLCMCHLHAYVFYVGEGVCGLRC